MPDRKPDSSTRFYLRLVPGLCLGAPVWIWTWLLLSLLVNGNLDWATLDGLFLSLVTPKHALIAAGLNLVVVLPAFGLLLRRQSSRMQLVLLIVIETGLAAAAGFYVFNYQFNERIVILALSGALAGAVAWGVVHMFVPRDETEAVAEEIEPGRRRMMRTLATGLGGLGAAGTVASVVPPLRLLAQADNYVDVDISDLAPGQLWVAVIDNNRPVWIFRRSPAMLAQLEASEVPLADPDSEHSLQPPAAKNPWRAIRADIAIYNPVCTHLGCITTWLPEGPDPATQASGIPGGQFFCPCHGAVFDLAGRVYAGMPAARNLDVPRHRYLGDNVVRIYYTSLREALAR